jgi:hypothetical protein
MARARKEANGQKMSKKLALARQARGASIKKAVSIVLMARWFVIRNTS